MSLVQLIFTLLGLMCIFAIIFFVLLFQIIKMRKSLHKKIVIFKRKTEQYKKIHNINISGTSTTTYHPAKSLRKILILNMIPTLVFLAVIILKAPLYIIIIFFVLFINAALLLPVYYLFLKKHDTNFFLKNNFKTNNLLIDNEKAELILEFDQGIALLNKKITYNTLYAFELLNLSMICDTVVQFILMNNY